MHRAKDPMRNNSWRFAYKTLCVMKGYENHHSIFNYYVFFNVLGCGAFAD